MRWIIGLVLCYLAIYTIENNPVAGWSIIVLLLIIGLTSGEKNPPAMSDGTGDGEPREPETHPPQTEADDEEGESGQSIPQSTPLSRADNSKHNHERMPDIRELLYPAELPAFEDIAEGGHSDTRAVIYTIIRFDTGRQRPFSTEDLFAQDFGRARTAYSVLLKTGMAKELEPCEEIAELFTKPELTSMAGERGLPKTGNKLTIAGRLINSGYKINRRKYRARLFRLTDRGVEEIRAYYADRQGAVNDAVSALKEQDYQKAVSAYREFDNKWGFVHTSGKRHTIFAHYDVPGGRFIFVARYDMRELKNTKDFKCTLRACLFAGLMRGCQDCMELRNDFEGVCTEKINCPGLLKLFDYDKAVLMEMQKQIDYDIGKALEYYISHVLYLCRRWGGITQWN